MILGVILGIASVVTLIQMSGESRGEEFIGVLIGFLLLGGLAGWLIYSGTKSDKNDNKNA